MISVGIDFDNTLINYHQLFAIAANDLGWIESQLLTKEQVKERLLTENGDDARWQQLQTAVYSDYIQQAKPYDGVKCFCEKVIASGNKLVIISHKTSLSNYDHKTALIEPTKQWLMAHGFIGDQGIMQAEHVFFLESREQKLLKIQQENIDIFVDDLAVVLTDQLFPQATLGILFSETNEDGLLASSSWYEISAFYDLCVAAGMRVAHSLVTRYKRLPEQLTRISVGGNSCVYRAKWQDQGIIVKRARNNISLKNEYRALNLFKGKLNNVPQAILLDETAGVLVESALIGNKVTEIGCKEIAAAIDFLAELDTLGRKGIEYQKASQHRDSLLSYIQKVEERLINIRKDIGELVIEESIYNQVTELLNNKFDFLWSKIKHIFSIKMENMLLRLNDQFEHDELILSPSDYGFHNMFIAENGSLQVYDFEYFGWDDKAKLVADFFHHHGHELTDENKIIFIKGLYQRKIINEKVLHRLELVLDIIGMEWVLIVLNVVNKDKLVQKTEAGNNYGVSALDIIKTQVSKAESILDKYIMRSQNNNFFITSDIDVNEWAACYV